LLDDANCRRWIAPKIHQGPDFRLLRSATQIVFFTHDLLGIRKLFPSEWSALLTAAVFALINKDWWCGQRISIAAVQSISIGSKLFIWTL
jgi:hypothetical protein